MWWTKFKSNLAYAYHYATAWFVAVYASLFAFMQTLDDATKAGFYDLMPYGLGKYVPMVLLVAGYFISKGWPQPKLEAKLQDKQAQAVESTP